MCHIAGTRELLYCLHSGISSGPVEPGSAASSPTSFSLAFWMYESTLRTPHFWSTLHFSDNLWGGAKMFQQVKTCVAGDHLLSSEEHTVLVWELPFFLQVLPWWTGSSPTALLCHDLRPSPWHPCWWMRTSSGLWESAAPRPRAPATSRRSSSTTPPHCTCL